MSVDLRDVLADLAERAPSMDAVATSGVRTWRRARRARQRAVALVACLLVAVLAGGVAIAATAPLGSPAPVAPPFDPNALAIPNQVWMPSPWTPGTADDGPIGPLALIAYAPRYTSWFHETTGSLFGVSAATGTYRFIDLPGLSHDQMNQVEPALSPNGRYLGYFVAGTPTGAAGSDVVGFAAYDTVTGTVIRHDISTAHGLWPQSLTWSGTSGSLVATYYQSSAEVGAASSNTIAVGLDLATGLAIPMPGYASQAETAVGNAGARVAAIGGPGDHSLMLFDPISDGLTDPHVDMSSLSTFNPIQQMALSPDGRSLVMQAHEPHRGFQRAYVVQLGGSARVPTRPHVVPGTAPMVWRLMGWADNTHLVVMAWPRTRCPNVGWCESSQGPTSEVFLVSTSTQRRTLLVQLHGLGEWATSPVFASDLLRRPVAGASQPAKRWDPRWVTLVVVVSVGLGALLLARVWLWRRDPTRRAPRRRVGARA